MSDESDIYEAFGRFLVEFEMTTNILENSVRTILDKEGMSNDGIADCILAGMTAEPLSSLVQSLCYEHLKPSTQTAKIIDYVFTQYRKLIAKRNELIHGQHFVFLAEDELDSEKKVTRTHSFKLHRNKKGAAPKRTQHTVESLNEIHHETLASLKNLIKIRNCLDGGYSIKANFEELRKGVFSAKNSLMVSGA